MLFTPYFYCFIFLLRVLVIQCGGKVQCGCKDILQAKAQISPAQAKGYFILYKNDPMVMILSLWGDWSTRPQRMLSSEKYTNACLTKNKNWSLEIGNIVLLHEFVRVQFPQSRRPLRICREGQNSSFRGEAPLSLFFWPSPEHMSLTQRAMHFTLSLLI